MGELETIFTTERLLVRPWTHDDLATILAIYRDPEVTQFLGATRTQQSLADSEEWLARVTNSNRAAQPGLGSWAVVLRATGEPIGTVALVPLDGGPEVEVAYHLGRQSWGHGYATELARGLVAYGFTTVGLPRIVGITIPENIASQQVLLKAGLRQGEQRQYYGHVVDYFALDAADWVGTAGDKR